MAEVAASIIGLVTFGVQISGKLYDAGTCISSVRSETNDVANSIKLYSDVLDFLAERLRADRPVHSLRALSMAEALCYESTLLFTDIDSLLPLQDRSSKQGLYSWKQKIKWVFRKKQVAELVTKLEGLKNTVNLLATVLFAGVNHRERAPANARSAIRDVSAAVVDYVKAVQLQENCNNDDIEDEEPIADNTECQELMVVDPSRSALALRGSARPLLRLTEELESIQDPAKRLDKLLSQSEYVAIQLLLEWTCVMSLETNDALHGYPAVGEYSQPDSPAHSRASSHREHADELSCDEFVSWIEDSSNGSLHKDQRDVQHLLDCSSEITGEAGSEVKVKLAVDGGFYNIIVAGQEHIGVVRCTKGRALVWDLACRIKGISQQWSNHLVIRTNMAFLQIHATNSVGFAVSTQCA